jgi:methylthioribose-1-phosphate isomerase
MEKCLREQIEQPVEKIQEALKNKALNMRDEDVAICRAIGQWGLTLLKPQDGILTHCNAGRLATIAYGTATAPIYLGQEKGYNFRVFVDETRPLFPGGPGSIAYELAAEGWM